MANIEQVHLKDIQVYIVNEEGDRVGNQCDVKRLLETFGKFGESVNVQSWSGNIQEVVNRFAECVKSTDASSKYHHEIDELKKVDAVFVVAMCHSKSGQDIKKHFYKPLTQLKELNGKFVLLISQGCRGVSKSIIREKDGPTKYHIMWFSTSEDVVAIRTAQGSPFITGVCQHLVDGARVGSDLAKIIRESVFEENIAPTYTTCFNENSKHFYLPKLMDDAL